MSKDILDEEQLKDIMSDIVETFGEALSERDGGESVCRLITPFFADMFTRHEHFVSSEYGEFHTFIKNHIKLCHGCQQSFILAKVPRANLPPIHSVGDC